jgi:hypothetical protein
MTMMSRDEIRSVMMGGQHAAPCASRPTWGQPGYEATLAAPCAMTLPTEADRLSLDASYPARARPRPTTWPGKLDELAHAGVTACDELIAGLIEVRGSLVDEQINQALGAAAVLDSPKRDIEAVLRVLSLRNRVTR